MCNGSNWVTQIHSVTKVPDKLGQSASPVEIAEMCFSSDNKDVGGKKKKIGGSVCGEGVG